MSKIEDLKSKGLFTIGKDEQRDIVITESGEYRVELSGEGAGVKIIGGWYLKNSDILTVKLTVVHKAPHTTAYTLLKAVVGDSAQADIRGRIIVEKKAQQTESFLRESMLLISPQARAIAIPDLEIEANDVHCSHAAAVSRVDEEQLYYLMSRGIIRSQAVEMVVEGFLKEVGVYSNYD